jgi:hypothetical protein
VLSLRALVDARWTFDTLISSILSQQGLIMLTIKQVIGDIERFEAVDVQAGESYNICLIGAYSSPIRLIVTRLVHQFCRPEQ